MSFNQLSLSKPKQNDCLFHIADAERLIVMVQYEDFAAQFVVETNRGCFEAEDEPTSFHYISDFAKLILEDCSGFLLKI
jgi:hypothetical protein